MVVDCQSRCSKELSLRRRVVVCFGFAFVDLSENFVEIHFGFAVNCCFVSCHKLLQMQNFCIPFFALKTKLHF